MAKRGGSLNRVLSFIAVGLGAILMGAIASFYWLQVSRPAHPQVIDGSDANLHPGDADTLIADVLRDFFDPEAARFASLHYSKPDAAGKTTHICGYVNGKNRLGGYIGYRPFFYVVADRETMFLPSELSDQPGAEETFRQLIDAMGCPRP